MVYLFFHRWGCTWRWIDRELAATEKWPLTFCVLWFPTNWHLFHLSMFYLSVPFFVYSTVFAVFLPFSPFLPKMTHYQIFDASTDLSLSMSQLFSEPWCSREKRKMSFARLGKELGGVVDEFTATVKRLENKLEQHYKLLTDCYSGVAKFWAIF